MLEAGEQFLVSNAVNFVLNFELKEEFEELMGCPIDEWEVGTGMADSEVIGELLEQLDGLYFYRYDRDGEFFEIWKLKDEELFKDLEKIYQMLRFRDEFEVEMAMAEIEEIQGRLGFTVEERNELTEQANEELF